MNSTLLVTDSNHNYSNIKYVQYCIEDTVKRLGGNVSATLSPLRAELTLSIDESTLKYLVPSIIDKVADIIAVSYKYNYFRKNLRLSGLDGLQYELLLSALISADIDDDKRYIRGKFSATQTYAIDGAFNFTMKPLKDKWNEVVSYIPSVFFKDQLREFISYLVKEKGGRRVFVDGGKVYDRHFNRLSRSMLTAKSRECEVLREVILSASGEVELASKLPEIDEFYLKEFFGDKIFFRKSYFA